MSSWKVLAVLATSFLAALFCQADCPAEIKMGLHDDYLEKESSWAMYIDVQDVNHYLNYPKSSLHPLTRVRISYRAFSNAEGADASHSKPYEILWYYGQCPIGQARYMDPVFEQQSLGMIALGTSNGSGAHSMALTNALLRLLVELQFKNVNVSNVLVPGENYEQVANCLNYYHFSPGLKIKEGKQMSVHLCCSNPVKEQFFFLNK